VAVPLREGWLLVDVHHPEREGHARPGRLDLFEGVVAEAAILPAINDDGWFSTPLS